MPCSSTARLLPATWVYECPGAAAAAICLIITASVVCICPARAAGALTVFALGKGSCSCGDKEERRGLFFVVFLGLRVSKAVFL